MNKSITYASTIGLAISSLITGCASSKSTFTNSTQGSSRAVNQTSSGSASNSEPVQQSSSTKPVQVDFIHMTNPHDGYGTSSSGIFRTTDGGSTWKDISPKGLNQEHHFGSQFKTSNQLWVAVPPFKSRTTSVSLLSSHNQGRNWTRVASVPIHFTSPSPVQSVQVDFVDKRCGFLMVTPQHGMQSEPGQLLATSDGGHTWKKVATTAERNLPTGGRMRFLTKDDGWLVGSPTCTTCPMELYHTTNGERHGERYH
ncbi:hypothetical protein [Alicyclobacillus sp. SO9]|uniref:WD40/YVTN/BNR-like repeat-containing protein n=1 Tax=Alicyclobacillus sp. SO9 TaxID=2665646 RepID=UPI0018E7997D|nr:hypothetical protein [Alicyclobacillus sp. SO9]QQE77079.1 hypothetical protein GI364_13945 [Alicyclobacillus sp. SO9]